MDLRLTATYVLNLCDGKIYERACFIWDGTREIALTRTKYVTAFESNFNEFVSRIERKPTARSYEMSPVCVLLTVTVACFSWSCVLW